MHETIFCQKTEVFAATSNLHVEQNLVHLGRCLHFSQKVVGVTLKSCERINAIDFYLFLRINSLDMFV